MAIEDSNKEIR